MTKLELHPCTIVTDNRVMYRHQKLIADEPDLALDNHVDDEVNCQQDNNLHKRNSVLDESVAEPRPPVNRQTTIDLVSDVENDDDDSESGWENPPC